MTGLPADSNILLLKVSNLFGVEAASCEPRGPGIISDYTLYG